MSINDAKSYYDSGIVYLGSGVKEYLLKGKFTDKAIADYDRAIVEFDKAIQLNPNYVEAYVSRSIVHSKKGNLDQAFADCEQAIRLNPNYARAYHGRSAVYVAKMDFDRAIADLEIALRIDPNIPLVKENLQMAREMRSMMPEKKIEERANNEQSLYREGDEKMSNIFDAIENGDLQAVEKCLLQGADIEAKISNGSTSLHIAAQKGHLEIVNLLVEKGANIDAKANDGMTPLHVAAINGRLDIVKILLENGADIEAKNYDGEASPLFFAVNFGYLEVIKLLIEKGANIEAKFDSLPLLNSAVYNGHLEVVRLLIEKGANIDAKANNGMTPLHVAAIKGHFAIAKLLIEKGANIEARGNKIGATPLIYAIDAGHIEVVKVLIMKGANIEAKDNSGDTPLQRAMVNRHLEIAKLLSEKGRDKVPSAPQIQKPSPAPIQQNNTFFTDPRDGQTYRTVKIGNQVWMAENLNYKTANGSWYYENDSDYGKKYGLLYDWKTALKVAPPGWHLPSDEEWKILEKIVGVNAGTKLKAKGEWNDYTKGKSGDGTDDYGFSALLGGYRLSDGSFYSVDSHGYWWSATESDSSRAFNRFLFSGSDDLNRSNGYEENGDSVRCLRD